MAKLASAGPGQCWDGFGLTITVTKADRSRASLRLAGDLDIASARMLTACLETQLADGRRFIRMDFSGLAFVDSAGLDAVLEAHDAFLRDRGTLILVGIRGTTKRVVHLLHLDSVLLIAAGSDTNAAVHA
ncbi:MAG: STAS domain-containing protein [Actinomycetota bacterium]|nr:STAS domain-containing protein [Actinomycetota bacterium]